MNPTIEFPGKISGFTLALLKGTGWYKVDIDSGMYYDLGKDDGCRHFEVCPKGKEYCTGKESPWQCTSDF